jgi:hypothetical protein
VVTHRVTSRVTPRSAALVGAGVVALWDDYRSPGWRGWILPLTLAGAASLQSHILAHFYSDWSHWLAPAIVILGLATAVSLAVARLKPRLKGSGYPLALAAISVGVVSLFLAPAVWAASTIWYGAETRSPTAGPQAGPSETSSRFGSDGSEVDPLVDYLHANQGDTKYLVAAIDSGVASPIILNTDEPVIAFGGFEGRDPVFSKERLAGLVSEGKVRFFVIEERDIEQAKMDEQEHLGLLSRLKAREDAHKEKSVRWITDNCEQVSQESWQSSTSTLQPSTVLLYDCGS